MKRTLLAVGVTVLVSLMLVPYKYIGSYMWHGPFFTNENHDPVVWDSFVLQTVFLVVLAAVMVNLFPRRTKK